MIFFWGKWTNKLFNGWMDTNLGDSLYCDIQYQIEGHFGRIPLKLTLKYNLLESPLAINANGPMDKHVIDTMPCSNIRDAVARFCGNGSDPQLRLRLQGSNSFQQERFAVLTIWIHMIPYGSTRDTSFSPTLHFLSSCLWPTKGLLPFPSLPPSRMFHKQCIPTEKGQFQNPSKP